MTITERYATETISHSGLNALRESPRAFRIYKDYREEGESTAALRLGSLVHCLILEPDQYEERYVVAPNEVPTPMYKVFVEELVRSLPLYEGKPKRDWYAHAYQVAGFTNPLLPRVIERYETEEVFKEYFSFLATVGTKAVLTSSDLAAAMTCKESTASHKLAFKLLHNLVDEVWTPGVMAFNEQQVVWKYPGYEFRMNSIIDRLIVDRNTHTVYLIDLKTTSKALNMFHTSFVQYGYHRQMFLYLGAVCHYLRDLGEDPSKYRILPYIVVVQTKDLYETAVYQPSLSSLAQGRIEVELLLERLKWHFENDLWDFSREYYEGDGSLILDCNGSDSV